jgi:CHAT domain-containing protein
MLMWHVMASFDPPDPMNSSLLLAGSDELTLGDIFAGRADLSAARLVTLSSCESGRFEFRQAPDESLRFPTGLMLAGVPGVISTMWPVDDAASAVFISQLYERLLTERLEPADALAQTRKWLREATAADLISVVTRLRGALQPEDDDADRALSILYRNLASGDRTRKPYASRVFSAAFILTGL